MTEVSKLHDAEEIARRVDDLAREIAETMPADFLMIGVLKGGFVFMADLIRAVGRLGLAPGVDFMTLRSYGESTVSSGTVNLVGNSPTDIHGRPVLLVDDIL